MSEKEYIVSLNKGVDYKSFNQEMIANTGAGDIPGRSVNVANARPASQRNTHYSLTDTEAEALKNDPRVYGVTLNPELDPNIGIGFDAVQPGDFSKTTLDRGDFLNWGMRRMNEATNPYDQNSVEGSYNYTLDASGVDVVIMDSGLQIDHPEFQDALGESRVVELDWTTASNIPGMPAQNENYYRDFDGHGTHVAGTAAGKTYGWAKNAKIYSLKLAGLEGPGDSGTGTGVTYAFDCIKEWHNNKPIDPVTGFKRPTVVNMSWGYLRYYNTVSSMTYQGVEKTGTDIDSSAKRHAFGLVPIFNPGAGAFVTNVRIPSVDVDMEELIDAGVHVMVAAGNRSHKVDVPGGDDYNNVAVTNTGSINYHRGSSPYSINAHIVGNIDSNIHIDGLEQKAVSSEAGPGVSVFAPGTDIMSAMSTTNNFGATTLNNPYPANSNFLINNISGTSMASPQIAGMTALWLQLNPGATPAQGLAFVNSSAKVNQLYDTISTTDYSTNRSLLGSSNRFAFNKFNSSTQLKIGNPVINIPVGAGGSSYSIIPATDNVNEGVALTFNVSTVNVPDLTTLYWTINSNAGDFQSSIGNFTISDNTGSFSVTPTLDSTSEGAEIFTVSLRTGSAEGTVVATSADITINDTSQTPQGTPTYSVAPTTSNVNEGSTLTFNVSTTNVSDLTTLYWSVTNAGDFGTTTGNFTVTGDTGTFTVTPTADITTEGAETFTASVRTGSVGGTIVATSSEVTINDTSTSATYTATPQVDNVDEGSTLTIDVATTNVADGTTLYWSVTNADDFSTSTGNFTVTAGAGSFTVTPSEDITTEGAETFQAQIRTGSVSGAIVETTDAITINDTSLSPTYTATPVSNAIDEGSALTINVATTNVADATTLYWTATNSSDFATSSGSFDITSDAGSFTVTPTADETTEGTETFQVAIRLDNIAGTVVETTGTITINDTSTAPEADYTINVSNIDASNYILTGNDANGVVNGNDPALAFNNGDVIDFVVDASGHPFYIKTAPVTGTGSVASGVTNNGTQSGTIRWTVGSTGTFYYQCSVHGAMGAAITIT